MHHLVCRTKSTWFLISTQHRTQRVKLLTTGSGEVEERERRGQEGGGRRREEREGGEGGTLTLVVLHEEDDSLKECSDSIPQKHVRVDGALLESTNTRLTSALELERGQQHTMKSSRRITPRDHTSTCRGTV